MKLRSNFQIAGLTPFKVYNVSVEVCTIGGCTKSPKVSVTTAEDLPTGNYLYKKSYR